MENLKTRRIKIETGDANRIVNVGELACPPTTSPVAKPIRSARLKGLAPMAAAVSLPPLPWREGATYQVTKTLPDGSECEMIVTVAMDRRNRLINSFTIRPASKGFVERNFGRIADRLEAARAEDATLPPPAAPGTPTPGTSEIVRQLLATASWKAIEHCAAANGSDPAG